ncbi:hypothetical protein JCM11641_006265 [Rhodosporidiobolus odoratus]
MPNYVFPPLETSLSPSSSPLALAYLADAWLLSTWISLMLLLWDWASHLSVEREYVWAAWGSQGEGKRTRSSWERWAVPGRRWKIGCFATARYLTLAQAVWVVAQLTLGRFFSGACSAARGLPFGFSLASVATHFVLAYRMFSVFSGSFAVFYSLLLMAVIDIGLQLAADVLVQPVCLDYAVRVRESTTSLNLCYLTPTTRAFAIAFISPSLFSHTVLLLTLFASWRHWTAETALSAGGNKSASLMASLRKQHAGYVLAICLINFANVVLVLQADAMSYQLIWYLPSLVLTHLLLANMWFSLENRLDTTSSTASAVYSLPHVVVTPSSSPPPGTAARRTTQSRLLSQQPSQGSATGQPLPTAKERVAPAPEQVTPPAKERLSLRAQRLRRRGSSLETLEIQPSLRFSAPTQPGESSEVLAQPTVFNEEVPLPSASSSIRSDATTPTSAVPLFHLPTREVIRKASLGGGWTADAPSPSSPRSAQVAGPSQSAFPVECAAFPMAQSEFSSASSAPLTVLDFPTLPPHSYPIVPSPNFLLVPTSSPSSASSPSSSNPRSNDTPHLATGYAGDKSASPSPSPSLGANPPHSRSASSLSLSSFSTAAQHAAPCSPPVPIALDFYDGTPSRSRVLSVNSASQVEGYLSRSTSARRLQADDAGDLNNSVEGGEEYRRGSIQQTPPSLLAPMPPLQDDEDSTAQEEGLGEAPFGKKGTSESEVDPMLQPKKGRKG